ncbi:MAG TPA: hypothetical protein VHD62_02465 [Opitutaceae bacterium]|nr:hypothetical protein [Opitutaceae bacterium]
MTIHWSLFVPGVLLLLYPADRLLSSLVELRSFDCFQNLENSPRYRPWWWVLSLWLDPLRGFLGTLLLMQALAPATVRWALAPKLEYALLVVVVAAGVVCQTFTRRGDTGVLLAPIGFVAGAVAALTPWPVALIGIVTGALGLCAFRQFHAFFAFGLAAVSLLGLVLGAGMMWIAPAVGVFALPIVVGLVTSSTLELPTRNASGPPPMPLPKKI